MITKDKIDSSLSLLGDRLEALGGEPVALLVCGGASLIATRMAVRDTTKDIDVVAIVRNGTSLEKASPFPENVAKAIAQVATMLDLPENWMNPGPTDLLDAGLPDGIMERLAETRRYGSSLTVHFVGRTDQIHFKLFAAVVTGSGRHLTDLLELEPSPDEIERAARWAMCQDPSEGFLMVLKDMLRKVGYEQVADRI